MDRIQPRTNRDEDEIRSEIEMVECIFEMAQTGLMSSINVFITTLRIAKDTLRSIAEQGLETVEQRTQARAVEVPFSRPKS